MTLQSSGAISLSNIAGEFGGSTPHSLSEYYRGGGLVQSHSGTAGIPSSGTISFNQFYGKTATAPVDNNVSFTCVFFTTGSGKMVFNNYGANSSMSDGSVVTNNGTSLTITTIDISSLGINGIAVNFGGAANAGTGYAAYNTGAIRGMTLGNGTNYSFLAPQTGSQNIILESTASGGTVFGLAAAQLAYMQGANGSNVTFTFTY